MGSTGQMSLRSLRLVIGIGVLEYLSADTQMESLLSSSRPWNCALLIYGLEPWAKPGIAQEQAQGSNALTSIRPAHRLLVRAYQHTDHFLHKAGVPL